VLIEACACAGFSPPFHVEAHDYRSAIAFVAAGVGITVLPNLGAADLPAGVVALPLVRPTPTRSIYAVVRDAAGRTPPVALAVNLLRDIAGQYGSAAAPTGPQRRAQA
jgi:DNA-binding transcriptional LysR family regulator